MAVADYCYFVADSAVAVVGLVVAVVDPCFFVRRLSIGALSKQGYISHSYLEDSTSSFVYSIPLLSQDRIYIVRIALPYPTAKF